MNVTIDREPTTIALPNTAERRQIHLINPCACKGKHTAMAKRLAEASGGEVVMTERGGFAEDYAAELFTKDRFAHLVVYGGDGTVGEAVNGIIRAGAGDKALLSVVPTGTGNDFVKSFNEKNHLYTVDALKYGDRYGINIINFGFDSNVVVKTATYKKAFPGSAAYIAGLADTLIHKMGERWTIELTLANGRVERYDETFTLALCANCQYYGGGFRAAPLADCDDGLIDFVAVKKVSRPTFISLVGSYKKGTHLDPATGRPHPKFEKHILYRRCKRVRISGISRICVDGELEERNEAEISVVPAAIRFVT
jgi:diacylglycerol kinase family enzyme